MKQLTKTAGVNVKSTFIADVCLVTKRIDSFLSKVSAHQDKNC